jgi:hypothetical protein
VHCVKDFAGPWGAWHEGTMIEIKIGGPGWKQVGRIETKKSERFH